ncbi:MAG: adenylate kinase [Bacillota bacterium]|nr:adenylate kinase [Bacillota bacterium]
MNIILLGAPGAGKGTQAIKIAKAYGLQHISTGDMLRAEMAKGTELGRRAQGYMQSGQLVPDDLIIAMIMERFDGLGQKGMLLDGFPRTVAQAEALDKRAKVDAVINLTVPEDVIMTRICGRRVCPACGGTYHISRDDPKICRACGGELVQRPDDNPETVKKRLDTYLSQTAPLVDYYAARGILHSVDGSISIEYGFMKISAILEKLKNR